MDRDNSKRASSNTQSACRISHTSVTAVLLAAHICERYVWLASARLSAPVSLLFFPGSEPGRSVAARLMSAAVLCMEARQSQPRCSVPGCKLTCSLPIPHLPDPHRSDDSARVQQLHYPDGTRSAWRATPTITAPSRPRHFTQLPSPISFKVLKERAQTPPTSKQDGS